MALPTVIASNQTAGTINLDRLGLSVPASGTLELTLYAFVDEIKNDDSLHQAIVDNEILLDFGQGELTKGESLKFFGIVTHEARIQVTALSDADISPISGVGQTVDTSVTLAADDRVLLTAQSPATENGVWVVKSGAWERPDDFAAGTSASAAMVYVAEGNTYGSQLWACDSLLGSDVIDTNSLSFSAISGGGGGGGEDLQQTYDNGTGGDGSAGLITTNPTDGRVEIGGDQEFRVSATNGLNVDTIADFDVTTFDVQMTGTNGFSIDGTAASNVTVDSGNLTASTTTSGEVLIDGVSGVEVNSSSGPIDIGNDANTGAINIGTGAAARDITIGNTTGTTGVTIDAGTGEILLNTNTTINGNLDVQGTTTSIDSEVVNIADNYLYLNKDYTGTINETGGLVVNRSAVSGTSTTTDTGGFASASVINVTDASIYSVGDIIQISGAANSANDGIYEVLSIDTVATPDEITIDTTPTEDFSQTGFTVDATDTTASVEQVNVTVLRQNGTTGEWEVGIGNTVPLTYKALATTDDVDAVTLQVAYDNDVDGGGATITTNVTDGSVIIAGDQSLQVTATSGLDVDTVADFDVTTFDVLTTGNNGFSVDGTADSNLSVSNNQASTDVTLTIGADNTGATAGDAVVDITPTSTNGVAAVTVNGLTHYGASAGNPTALVGGFQEGDVYYDTALDMEMRYDSTRSKWLSVEATVFTFGRNGNTNAGQYLYAHNRVMSATLGFIAPHNGTIVAAGITRTDTDSATFDFVEGGTSRATLASTGNIKSVALDGDFSADGILAVVNQAGGNAVSNVIGWFKVRYRG